MAAALIGGTASPAFHRPRLGAAEAQSAAEDIDTSGIVEMFVGSEDAPVTVIEYASFTCPHCRAFHEDTYGDLKTNYIDAGKVKFVLREIYFDRFGLWAGMVARCSGPDRYFGIVDILFTEQSEWTAGGDPTGVATNLRKIGRRAGLDNEQVEACLQDGDKAQALVALYQKNAQADDVSATPTFIINGEKYSNMSFGDFSTIIDEQLGQ